jgi:hypothetical protein
MCEVGSASSPTVRLPPMHGTQPVLLPAPVEKPLALVVLAAHTAVVSITMPTHAEMFVCAAAVSPAVCPLEQAAQPEPAALAERPVLLYVSAWHTSDVAHSGPVQPARHAHAQLPLTNAKSPEAPAEEHTGGCAHDKDDMPLSSCCVSHAAPLHEAAQMHTKAPALALKPRRPPGGAHAGGRAMSCGAGASHTTPTVPLAASDA